MELRVPYIIILLGTLASVILIGASYDEILTDKNRQLGIVRKEIEDIKKQLSSKENEFAVFESTADSLASELTILNNFLKDYNEKYLTPEEIAKETGQTFSLEKDVEKIRKSLKNKIISLYKHGKNYELELLMSSKTPNEFMRRNQYLQKFAQNRKKELRELKSKKYILSEKKKMLNLSTSSQRIYVELKRNDKASLEGKLEEIKMKRAGLQYQQKLLSEKIQFKEKQSLNIKNFIGNFTEHKATFRGNKTSRVNYTTESMIQLKGKLNIPVDAGLVTNRFGESINNATATASFNSGIDISVSKNSRVYSVSGGTVSLSGEVPYYGKIIIIVHDNGFRSVYASLSTVDVKPGDIIRLNQVIGKSGETLEGQMLHFELWQLNNPLNPEEWLRF